MIIMKHLHKSIKKDVTFNYAITDERKAQKFYDKLAIKYPKHRKAILEIKHDESTHERKLKRLKSR